MTSIIVGILTFFINNNWKDFKTALLATGLAFGCFAIAHFLRSPWLTYRQTNGELAEPGTWAGVLGLAIIAAVLIGGTELGRVVWAARPLGTISPPQVNAPVPPIVQTKLIRIQGPCKVSEEQINPARLPQPCPGAPPPTRQDTVLAINAHLTEGDRNRFSNALSEFEQSLDQGESIFNRVAREGTNLQNELLNGAIVKDVDTHRATLDGLSGEGRKWLNALPALLEKWRTQFQMQDGYIFGDNYYTQGPGALVGAATEYNNYLRDWNSIQNKNEKPILELLGHEQGEFNTSMIAFQKWDEGCRKRIAEMRNSIR